MEIPQGNFVFGAQDYSSKIPRPRVGIRVSTGTMLIRRCSKAPLLLQQWLASTEFTGNNETGLARVLHKVPTGVYHELPRTFSSVCNLRVHNWNGKLQHDSSIIHWNRSRHVIGYETKSGDRIKEEDWPPPEHVRMAAKP